MRRFRNLRSKTNSDDAPDITINTLRHASHEIALLPAQPPGRRFSEWPLRIVDGPRGENLRRRKPIPITPSFSNKNKLSSNSRE
jgi:hypothetical protein